MYEEREQRLVALAPRELNGHEVHVQDERRAGAGTAPAARDAPVAALDVLLAQPLQPNGEGGDVGTARLAPASHSAEHDDEQGRGRRDHLERAWRAPTDAFTAADAAHKAAN